MSSPRHQIVVWDPFVRVFHWSLLGAYVTAWATAEEWARLHERIGYFMLALIGLRLVWGLIGSRHARFGDFITGPRRTLAYVRRLIRGSAERFVGHNPAGGWMVLVLLISLVVASVSGIQVAAGSEAWEELHEGAANLSLLLVIVHVTVLAASVYHAVTWFAVSPKALPPIRLGGSPLSPKFIISSQYAASAVASLIILILASTG